MKDKRTIKYILMVAVFVFVAVAAFRGIATSTAAAKEKEGSSYLLLYNAEGPTFNAYVQSKSGVKSYQYAQTMQTVGDIIGDDRTADLHKIERPRNATGDVSFTVSSFTLSEEVKQQFTDLENGLRDTIDESFTGSAKIQKALIAEVDQRLKNISKGDLSYLIPLDCYLKVDDVEYDPDDPAVVSNALLETFMYKKKSNVTIVDGEADFSEKDMTSALMWKKKLNNISLEGTWLCQSIFAESDLVKGNLSRANLLGALIVGCDLRDCNLSNANLSGTTFIGSDLTGADLTGDMWKGTRFKPLGDEKVKVDYLWKDEISAGDVIGLENIEWVK